MTTHPMQFARHGRHPAHSVHTRAFGNKFMPTLPGHTGDKQHEKLVTQTEKWVAQTFYGELLKQMRNSPFKSKMFSGGRGGEAFGELFDQQLADRMSKGSGRKLVDAIVSKLEAAGAYKNASKLPGSKGSGFTAPHSISSFRRVA